MERVGHTTALWSRDSSPEAKGRKTPTEKPTAALQLGVGPPKAKGVKPEKKSADWTAKTASLSIQIYPS